VPPVGLSWGSRGRTQHLTRYTLLLAVGNIIVGTYAIISIAFIVAGVLGAARLYSDWSLGVAESIAGRVLGSGVRG